MSDDNLSDRAVCCVHSFMLPSLFSIVVDTISILHFHFYTPMLSFVTHPPLILPPFALHHSLLLLVHSTDSRWFLMSTEMWSRDHSQTGRHSLSSNSHYSSIIHTPIFRSGMRTFILKWYSIFMSWSSIYSSCIYCDKRHLQIKGVFCTLNMFIGVKTRSYFCTL